MSEALVGAAVNWWARRVGPRVVFDRDDARQEARIALWQAEKTGRGAHLYRRILDGMRKAIPGFRHREALVMVEEEHAPESWHEDTPDKALMAKQHLARIQRLPDAEREVVFAVMAGMTSVEIAAQRNVTEVRVSQLLARACRRLVEWHGIDHTTWEGKQTEPAPYPGVTLDQRIEAAKAAAMFNEAMKDDHATHA